MNLTIRIAERTDLPHIVAIYNQAISQRNATADLEPVSFESRREWLELHDSSRHPIYVAFNGGEVVGWCSLSPYRPGRQALRFTAEISYYVHEAHRRQGIGAALAQHAISQCSVLGIKSVFAILLDINKPSIGLLEKLGFEKWGHLHNVADIDGQECGHLYYGLRI